MLKPFSKLPGLNTANILVSLIFDKLNSSSARYCCFVGSLMLTANNNAWSRPKKHTTLIYVLIAQKLGEMWELMQHFIRVVKNYNSAALIGSTFYYCSVMCSNRLSLEEMRRRLDSSFCCINPTLNLKHIYL